MKYHKYFQKVPDKYIVSTQVMLERKYKGVIVWSIGYENIDDGLFAYVNLKQDVPDVANEILKKIISKGDLDIISEL